MSFYYFLIFSVAVILTSLLTLTVKILAKRLKIIDRPDDTRKNHGADTPLLGGMAIFLSFFIILYFIQDKLMAGNLSTSHWLGFFIGACFLMIGGFLDDKYDLKPAYQIIWPVLASLCVIAGGVEIEKITNPLGGFIILGFLSPILIFAWTMGMMYTTKLLDGLDGLVSGMAAIGGLVIFLFTITTKYYQPDIGLAALVFSACCFGFLVFNWHPAKIFLGEGGSLLMGYVLAVLAIISGGKIAIALLIMGVPIIDAIWTVVRRLVARKNPFKFADKQHLHFRLVGLGIPTRLTVLIYYLFSLIFGLSALFLQSKGKLFALGALIFIMLGVVITFTLLDKDKKIV